MGSFSIAHWLIILLIIGGIVSIVMYARHRSLRNSATLKGVGGWLIIPIIGFIGVIIFTLINLFAAWSEIEGLKYIFLSNEETAKNLRLPMLLSTGFGIAVIMSAATCLYKIFVSGVQLKRMAVLHYCLLAATGAVELWADGAIVAAVPGMQSDPTVIKEAARCVIVALVWIPYFLFSKRVANTFERPAFDARIQGA
jgi:hypothetical protein